MEKGGNRQNFNWSTDMRTLYTFDGSKKSIEKNRSPYWGIESIKQFRFRQPTPVRSSWQPTGHGTTTIRSSAGGVVGGQGFDGFDVQNGGKPAEKNHRNRQLVPWWPLQVTQQTFINIQRQHSKRKVQQVSCTALTKHLPTSRRNRSIVGKDGIPPKGMPHPRSLVVA